MVMARNFDISHSTLNVYSLSSIKNSADPVDLLVTTIKVPYFIGQRWRMKLKSFA